MKNKIKLVLLFAIMLPLAMFTLAGCGEGPALKSIEINDATINRTILKDSVVDTSKIKIKAIYEDETTEIIENSKLTFSDINTSTVGEKTLTITYLEKTTTIVYKVVNNIESTYNIVGFDKPDFVVSYESNIARDNNERSLYLDASDMTYLVGDDNPFHFLPEITALNADNQEQEINRYLSVSKIYEKQGSDFVELTDTQLTSKVAVNEEENTYDFTADAIGKEFKLSVRPFNLTTAQMAEINNWTINFTFKVIDGWNVHNIAEFSKLDNSGTNHVDGTTDYWATFKQTNNVDTTTPCSAIVVHSNLTLTQNDLPKAYFYNEGDADLKSTDSDYDIALNSLRDELALYNIFVDNGDTFTLHGNYFTFDASKIKLTVRESTAPSTPVADLSKLVANTSVICIGTGLKTSCKPSDGEALMGNFVVNNMKFLGNAQITNPDDISKYTGSLSCMREKCEKFTNNNVITQCFKTTYFSFGNLELNYCKGYDTYNANVHVWADIVNSNYYTGANNVANKCVFKNSSGPLVMLSQAKTETQPEFIFNDCVLENQITQSDPWFSAMSSELPALVTQMISMDRLFQAKSMELSNNQTKKGYTNEGAMTFISVVKGSGANGATKGFVVINETKSGVLTKVGETNMATTTAGLANTGMAAQLASAPVFSTVAGAFAYCNGTALNTLSPADATLEKLFANDYLGLFTPGATRLGCMVKYYSTNILA